MRAMRAATRFLFWAVVIASVLLASTVLLAKLALPLINVYQPQIERNLTQLTGMDVHVGDLIGELKGVNVEFRATDLSLDTPKQLEAIKLEYLSLELDIPKTLFTLSPQFQNVVLSGVDVLLQEDELGNITLKGQEASPSASSSADTAVSRVLNYAAEQQQVSLLDVSLTLNSPRFDELSVVMPATMLRKRFAKTLLRTDVFINDIEQPIQVRAQMSRDLTNFLEQQVQGYISVPDITLPTNWLAVAALEPLQSVSMAGEYWLMYQPNKGVTVQAKDSRAKLAFQNDESVFLKADWRLKYNDEAVAITVADLALNDSGRLYEGIDIKAEWESDGNRTFVVFNKMDAEIASKAALRFVPSEWRLHSILSGLEPRGEAKNASLRVWQGSEGVRFQYLSNLVDAQVNGHNGIPAADHIYGVFSLTDTQGGVEFKGRNHTLAFPTVYDSAWQVERSSGEVAWQRLDHAFVVTGDNLKLSYRGATVQGRFRLEQPLEGGVGDDELMLDLNAQHISKSDGLLFVPPKVLSNELDNWLEQALGQGEASNVDLLLRTGLVAGQGAPHLRLSIDTVLEKLTFDPNWPSANSVVGNVLVTENDVNVLVNQANFAGLPVTNLQVRVPFIGDDANQVMVRGQIQDNASKILQALEKTPLKSSVLTPFEGWRVTGDVAGSFDLKIPLSKELNPFVDLNLKFQQNNVMLAQADLPLDVESGRLHYQSSKGLYDTEFDVETLGGKSHLMLASQFAEDGSLIVSGALSGDIDAHEVALWRNAPKPVLSRLEGKTNYSGELEIGRSKPGQVDIYLKTDLSGVKLALPAPAAKASSRSVPTDVHITALNDEVLVDVSSQDWLYGAILANSNGLQGGHVSLAKPLPKDQKIEKGLSVYGQFDEFDWLTWQPIIEDFKSNLAESSSNDHQASQVPTNLPEWLRSAELLVDVLPINEKNQLNNVKLSYTRAKDGHPFSVASDEFNAVLNQTEAGPELHVHYLNWLTADKENKEADKESSLQPNIFPSISLKVDQLYIDNRPYGDWSAKVENLGNSLRIKDITTQLPKGQFVGQIFWQGGTKQNVELTIKAEGENARELTKKFSPTPFLSSNRYQTAVLLSWEDSLLSFDRSTLSGKINFNVQKGNFNQVDQLPPFLRLLGIFNVDALAKRLTFDFSDLYEPGMPFDRFSGNLAIAKGQLNTVEPVRVVSPTAEISLQGTANLVDETLNERLTATLPISSTLPVAGLLLATPQIAGLLYITDKLIGDQLSKVTSIQYQIEGPFSDPKVTPVKYSPIR